MIFLFDIYYAYKQYQSRNNGYIADIDIDFIDSLDATPDPAALNIGWSYMPQTCAEIPYEKFDLILFDNDHHGLEVCTEAIYQSLDRENCYLVAGAYLLPTHNYEHKIIWFPQQFVDRDCFTRPLYPQYFEKIKSNNTSKSKGLMVINGQSRAHRQYFIDKLLGTQFHNLEIKNNWSDIISETRTCFFESNEDSIFRDLVMNHYEDARRNETNNSAYYNSSMSIGFNGKFGLKAPGYVLIDEYFDHRCIIFPETSWINHQVFVTEKIIKCFVTNTVPWPIGGAGIHELYNKLGYQTAWNLLPDNFKQFDQEKDHNKRLDLCVAAIKWVDQNPQILNSKMAKKIVKDNYNLYHTDMLDQVGVVKLDQLLIGKWNERRY